jgi:ferric-dicitrate binding protein FerR (iron transport regulator)
MAISQSTVQNGEQKLSYSGSNIVDTVMNTLTIPRGKNYELELSDGTTVWLNAESSIAFPMHFGKGNRVVTLSGEAYFDVARKEDQPFVVKTDHARIEVLGTEFNVSAYPKTTQEVSLIKGKVKVSCKNDQVVLSPNEVATVSYGKIAKRQFPNISHAIAWTKGLFRFDNAPVAAVMNEIARWYDVQIQYDGQPDKTYTGEILRTATLQQVLEMLELAGSIHFTRQGNTVIVRP